MVQQTIGKLEYSLVPSERIDGGYRVEILDLLSGEISCAEFWGDGAEVQAQAYFDWLRSVADL